MKAKDVTKIVFLTMAVVASVAMAATPQTLVPSSIFRAGQSSNTYAHVIDGQTAYFEFQTGGVTKVENINGVQTSSVLFTHAQWNAVSGANNLTAFYGFGMSGNYLIWTDTGSDAVWKADKVTGAISNLVSKATIQAYIGGSSPNSLGSFTVAPNGGLTFFESTSKQFLNVDLSGTLTTVASGYAASITSGATYDAAGNFYYGDSTSETIYRVNTIGNIEAFVTIGKDVSFNDIFYLNGSLYYYDLKAKDITQVSAAGVVSTYVSAAELAAPAAITFGSYNGDLTYHGYTGDLYVVPEPATMTLLGLGGLVLSRFRKR